MSSFGSIARNIASFLGLTPGSKLVPDHGPQDIFDPSTATLPDPRRLLTDGCLTSAFIVEQYLAQIESYISAPHPFISAADRKNVIQAAYSLDDDRLNGWMKGPMHGLPVLISDAFDTRPNLGMEEFSDKCVLEGAEQRENAPFVDLLKQAGMIIIGQVRLPHNKAYQTSTDDALWSAIEKMAPIIITENASDSIVEPALRAALYGITTTADSNDIESTSPSLIFPGYGAMAKTPRDLVDIVSLLTCGQDYSSFLKGTWKGLKVGFVELEMSQTDTNADQAQFICREMAMAVSKIKAVGTHVQKLMTPNKSEEAEETLDRVLANFYIDVLFVPADGLVANAAFKAGYAIGAVPLGFMGVEERPFGMAVVAYAGEEGKVLRAMSAWEQTYPDARKRPSAIAK